MAGGTGKIVHQMRASGSLLDFKTITGASTSSSKGTPVELVASLPEAVQFVQLIVAGSSLNGSDSSMLLDIMTDTGGGDVVKIPNIQVGFRAGGATTAIPTGAVWGLPIAIPSGAQVLAQVATLIASDTVLVSMDFYGGFAAAQGQPADSIDTLGANTVTVKGVGLTTGLTDDANPAAWTIISASTPNAYKALAISVGGEDNTMVADNFMLDVGAGAPGSEVALIPDIVILTSTSEFIQNQSGVWPLENELASGSRLVARLRGPATNTDLNLTVHGIK